MRPRLLRPYHLMCLICRLADSTSGRTGVRALDALLDAVRRDPKQPARLRCHADGVYRFQNPGHRGDSPEGALYNEKRDLDILQRLGLVPGDTRPLGELFERVYRLIPSSAGICGYGAGASPEWRGCARAGLGHYEEGVKAGVGRIVAPRSPADCAEAKRCSAEDVLAAAVLRIRPHHLMCMTCFHGGRKELSPIPQDNLWEAIEAMRRRPDIPIELVRGCCMVCPPCSSYDPGTGLCVGGQGMSLRDQKKDLDVLQRLGLSYGDRLPARDLLRRLYERVPSALDVCGYGDGRETAFEWRVCGGQNCNSRYALGRQAGLGVVETTTGTPRS